MKKKVIIFEGLKGAGKTLLTNYCKKHLSNSIVLSESVTLEPIKHIEKKEIVINFYKKIINEIENNNYTYFLLDRFYFTKWPEVNYKVDYFKEIEGLLLDKFELILVLLIIDEDSILQRLEHTQNNRKETSWKLSYNGLSIEDEAKRDVERQRFFLKHKYKDSIIRKKVIINTTDLPKNIANLDIYSEEIIEFLVNE